MKQLTFDGREVDLARQSIVRPLNECQREILRVLRSAGSIRPVNAGFIVHAHRVGEHAEKHAARPRPSPSHGCCHFASSDGWLALRRLERRGLVRNPSRGLWVLV